MPDAHPDVAAASLLQRAARLIDSRFGPILDLQRQRLGLHEPQWWLATARMARYPAGALFNDSELSSAGTSLDAAEAVARALGEALERYSGVNVDVPFEIATLREAGMLGRWPACAADEPCLSSFRNLPPDAPLRQVRVRRVAADATTLVPAGAACLGYMPSADEPPVTLSISTGLAFHAQPHQAIWRGLCEVIERDAVMSFWWLHRPVLEIGVAEAPLAVRERLDRLAQRGMTARLFDITTELGIPSVFCTLTSDRYPALTVGAATRASFAAACAKALDEVVSLRVALQGHAARDDGGDEHRAPVTLVDHAGWYARGDRDGAFAFLLGGEGAAVPFAEFEERSVAEPASMAELAIEVRRIEAFDVSVLWLDVTAPEIRDLGTVARVVVPELVPLSPDDRVRWLATPRLLQRAGLSKASRADFTRHPHPFA